MDTPPAPAPDDGAEARRQRWQRLSAWLDEALDLPDDAARAAWRAALQAAPDEAAELDALLASHGQRTGLAALDGPPVLGARPAPGRAQPGQRVGPWRLHELLGQGGMAQVWRASRADGAYEREVALKLPLHLPWRDDLGERLARERDLLARLNHPHIARLYDAGVDDGHPWMAMERVDGRPLTAWCDAQRAGPRQRVRLFLQVLDAVSHAHGQLVLHRDLKPSNILVDGQGQVKLLDFGIAKLLGEDDRLTHDTRLTAFGGRALTLDYASPEQLRGEPLGAASDVYALGVLLHELLCGELPYRLPRRSAAQLETAILQDLPTRPSSRPGAEQSAHRGLTPRRLSRQLRGDLDAITLTALRKDPAQRYASAAELRADLQRWLDDEPVRARPDAWSYRARVFLRRHRAGVALGAVVSAALLASTVFSWQQARLAEREALRARATRDFLLGLYKPVSWLSAQPLRGGQVTARELLDLSAEQLQRAPVADPLVQQDLLEALFELYGDVGSAPDRLRLALALRAHTRHHAGADSAAHFGALVQLAQVQFESDRTTARLTLAGAEALLPRLTLTDAQRMLFWQVKGQLEEESRLGDAEQALEKAVALSAADGVPPLRRAQALMLLARLRWDGHGQLDEAVTLYERALQVLRDDPGLPTFQRTQAEVELGEALRLRGDFARSGELLRAAFQRSEQGLGLLHPDTAQTGLRLAEWLRATGQPKASAELLRRLLLEWSGRERQDDLLTVPNLHRQLAETLVALGQGAAALPHSAQALAGLSRRYGAQPSVTQAVWLLEAARAAALAGQARQALAQLARAQAEAAAIEPTPAYHRKLAAVRATVAVLTRTAQPNAASATEAALADWERAVQPPAATSHAGQVRDLAAVQLWRAHDALFARQGEPARAAAERALALLSAEVRQQVGDLEWLEAQLLAAEAERLLGPGREACQAAPTLAARLRQERPDGHLAALASALVQGCDASATAPSTALAAPWQARAARLAAAGMPGPR